MRRAATAVRAIAFVVRQRRVALSRWRQRDRQERRSRDPRPVALKRTLHRQPSRSGQLGRGLQTAKTIALRSPAA